MVKILIFFILTLLGSCLPSKNTYNNNFAQEIWAKSWGSDKNDVPAGITIDSLQNIYICGTTYGAFNDKNYGQSDILLIKTNSKGEQLWIKQWGTKGRDNPECITSDKSGFIYIAGNTNGELDSNKNYGAYDIFLTKLDSNGNRLWTLQWGTKWDDNARGITFDLDGNILITGYSSANITNIKTNTSKKNSDIILVKVNNQGQILWKKQWGTEKSEWGNDIKITKTGNIYICGWTQGELEKNKKIEFDDIFLCKLNQKGDLIWTRQWGTDNNDEANSLTIDSNENIYVTGRVGEPRSKKHRIRHDDIFLSKFNSYGKKIWSKQFGTKSNEEGKIIEFDGYSNIYILGSTYGEMKGCQKKGYNDLFLYKIDTSGKLLGIKQWGTGSFTIANSFVIYRLNAYLGGDISAGLNGKQNKGGNRDIFLLKWKL